MHIPQATTFQHVFSFLLQMVIWGHGVHADYSGRYARREDVIQAENGRDGNDSMSADSEGFLSSSDEDEPPTTGEADL